MGQRATCGSCAARRAALKASNVKFLWTPGPGSTEDPVTYDSEITAKMKVLRKGGSYRPQTG